ncbi:MAG: leucine-rich repeat domain-containing protein, partial [Candidatus Hermodarchaeota archaeon]
DCIKEKDNIGPFKIQIKKNHIIVLDLAGWNLETVPNSIKALSYLKKLNLWNNRLNYLPKSFGNLSNLEELYLDWNNFKMIPEIDWAKLKFLKKLSLTNNPELHINNLSHNHELIQYLGKKYVNEGVKDKEVSALIGLELLTGHKIRKLGNKTELNKLYACNYIINDSGNITGLYLYGYYGFQIKRIPHEVFSLNYLKDLIIRNQQIEMIPECIDNLFLLKRLDLMGNKLKELPKSLNQLKNLEYLDIEGNHIKHIPEIILNSEINLWV